MSANEAKVLDSSKLACYINDTRTVGGYILEQSDCSSLTNTLTALTAMGSDTRIIIDYLPTIIIAVSVLIIISVALAVFIYYRYEEKNLVFLILINPIIFWDFITLFIGIGL